MRIVNLETFRAMPEGTVYSKFEPDMLEGLMIKGETWEHDFIYQDLIGNIDAHNSEDYGAQIDTAIEGKTEVRFDFHCMGRDGLFEDKQLFAVYDKYDVASLIARLKETL